MGMNTGSGPDMTKMLQMMMPYLDPSAKRMMNIMMKLQELKVLMEPEKSQGEEKAAQPQKEYVPPKEWHAPGQDTETEDLHRPMDDHDKADHEKNLAAALQDGLTPEQRNMITSLTGMLR